MWNLILQIVNFINQLGGLISSTVTPILLAMIITKLNKFNNALTTLINMNHNLQAMEVAGNQEVAGVSQLIKIMTAAATGKALATNVLNPNMPMQ
jgi:hypothetical protein